MGLEPHLPLLLQAVCVMYFTAALVHVLLQNHYAVRHARDRQSWSPPSDPMEWPSVDILVPCYNEDPGLLDLCLTSVAKQDYPGPIRVAVIDDRSDNRAELLPVFHRHGGRAGWQVELLQQHVGKRHAMDAGLRPGDGEVVVTVDSDCVLLPDAIRRIVAPFQDDLVAAVSGSLRALNADTNRLTRLINLNYRWLFEQQRAAQGSFRTVLCCNGGLSAFRRAALEKVWLRHLEQTVAGRRCTTGDDLHLTLQLLAAGYDTVIEPEAMALTLVPDNLRWYARQQLRWNRSFIRELPLAARAVVGRRPPYVAFDLAYQAAAPLMGTAVALLWAVEALVLGMGWLVDDASLVTATFLVTTAFRAAQTRDSHYLLYTPVYLSVVFPGWLGALATPARDGWKTRDLPSSS